MWDLKENMATVNIIIIIILIFIICPDEYLYQTYIIEITTANYFCKRIFVIDVCRSSHLMCPIIKGAPKNFAKYTGKYLCQSLFLNKVGGLRPATLLKKRLWHRCLPMNFAKFLIKPFLQNTSGRPLLMFDKVLNTPPLKESVIVHRKKFFLVYGQIDANVVGTCKIMLSMTSLWKKQKRVTLYRKKISRFL